MAEQDARKLVVVAFDDAMRAQEFLLVAMRLMKEGELALHDAVFISRDADGRSSVRETTDLTPGRGALGGALWGVLLGTLLGGPIGALVGGAASAGGGALLAKLIDTGIKDEQVKQLRETVRPGTTALALLVSHVSLGGLQTELARFPGATVVQSDLPEASVHAVRSAMDEAPPSVSDDPNIRIGLDDSPPAAPQADPTIRIGLDDDPGRPAEQPGRPPHSSSDPGGPTTPA
ncbi:MAG: DUF1269 domain-containing protein [Actinocatenispora sp.]